LCHWLKYKFVTQQFFSFQTNFCNYNDQKKTKLWTQCFLHLRPKNYKITYSLKNFQKYQKWDLISFKFLVLILLNFQWKNYSLFNNSYTIGLNITKPPKCPPPNSSRAFQQYQFETTYTIQYWKATQNQQGLRFPKYICKFTLYALSLAWQGQFQNKDSNMLSFLKML
jgi:hypothetical protein